MAQVATPQQLDLFSTSPAPRAPMAAPRRVARLERTIPAATWMPIAFVAGALAQPHATILHLVIDGMAEADSDADLVYAFGARAVRALMADEPATSQIRISDHPSNERAIIVEIRSGDHAPHSRMVIRDGAWHREPAARLPARRQRHQMGQEAYAAAYDQAQADHAKAIRSKTIRVILRAADAR